MEATLTNVVWTSYRNEASKFEERQIPDRIVDFWNNGRTGLVRNCKARRYRDGLFTVEGIDPFDCKRFAVLKIK